MGFGLKKKNKIENKASASEVLFKLHFMLRIWIDAIFIRFQKRLFHGYNLTN